MELEDVYSENDKYLIREYEKHGTNDFCLAELGGKAYVVPYRYTVGSDNVQMSQKRFLNALLDFNLAEAGKYRRAGQPSFEINYEGMELVVPYGKNYASAQQLAEEVFAKADAKYNTIVNSGRALEKEGQAPDMLEFTTTAANQYAAALATLGKTAVLDKNTPERLEIVDFLQHAGEQTAKKFKTSAKNMARQVGKKVIEAEQNAAKKFRPDAYKAAALAAILGAGAVTMTVTNRGCSDEKQQVEQQIPLDSVYTDFMGREHSDKFGNIQRIQQWKPEITALLVAVEGRADTAFKDGGGVPTIGSGTTFYLNEDGSEKRVKMGDVISPAEAMVHKWRYIDKHMIGNFGDDFGRSCTMEEAMAGIGAGFCWGPTAFSKSSFLSSMKKDENVDEQTRKLSGFRKQKGLLKRSYVLACCLSGAWTPKDLLDMPVYHLPNKGFVHCAIYTLPLHELLPCRKNGQGEDVPQVAADGFCFDFYLDRAQDIKEKMIAEAEQSGKPYKTVRDLMPEDMLRQLEPERYADANYDKYQRNEEKNDATRTFVASVAMFKNSGKGGR